MKRNKLRLGAHPPARQPAVTYARTGVHRMYIAAYIPGHRPLDGYRYPTVRTYHVPSMYRNRGRGHVVPMRAVRGDTLPPSQPDEGEFVTYNCPRFAAERHNTALERQGLDGWMDVGDTTGEAGEAAESGEQSKAKPCGPETEEGDNAETSAVL